MAHSIDLHTAHAYADGRSVPRDTKTRKLLVIGATRHTGHYVMRQALASGYAVTALARDPAHIDARHERLTVLQGDVMDAATLAPALAGQDAVISTIGATSRAPTSLYSEGMRHIIQASQDAGVQRLVAVSAAPLSRDAGDTWPSRYLMKPLLLAMLRPVYADMATMEEEIRASGLDWTIVRPPRLTDKPATGRYRTALNLSVRRGYLIGRADLAGAILRLLDDPQAIHAAVGVGY